MEERDTYGALAQSIMACGHPEHSHCGAPATASEQTPIEEIVEKMYSMKLEVLPVVDEGKLVGIISRKQVVHALLLDISIVRFYQVSTEALEAVHLSDH